ncbi:hypothetical protein PMAYCL1PPCAC_05507, partial [Pristionchus mayeri]
SCSIGYWRNHYYALSITMLYEISCIINWIYSFASIMQGENYRDQNFIFGPRNVAIETFIRDRK